MNGSTIYESHKMPNHTESYASMKPSWPKTFKAKDSWCEARGMIYSTKSNMLPLEGPKNLCDYIVYYEFNSICLK